MIEVKDSSSNQRRSRPVWQCILIVILLYMLQGITLALCEVMPLYLASFGATWKEQGTLSFIMYPFTVKLLWAPLIDVFYLKKLGRRQTWLLPVLVLLGVILVILSFYFENLLMNRQIFKLTVIFFLIMFLTATQDICVDGWALTLFSSSNLVWQSICQSVGQPIGSFLGSPILLTFESANMTNRLFRRPFGLPEQSYGLFTLGDFLRFWGVMFLVVVLIVMIFFRKGRMNNDEKSKKDEEESDLNLSDTYFYVVRLFQKKCFQQAILILIGPHFGYAATASMTFLVLINQGTIRRETLGLLTMPLVLIKSTAPLLLSRTHRPLVVYAYSYIPRLILCIMIAIFVFYSKTLKDYPSIFYGLLIVLLSLNDALVYFQGAARGGFFAYISDTRIGSTYYTFLASINNLGLFLSSTSVLHSANLLPKDSAYFIEVAICLCLGCLWLIVSWRLIFYLQSLPLECWHLKPRRQKILQDDDEKPIDPSNISTNTALLTTL